MVFSSVIFLTLFLPLFLGLYYAVPPRHRNHVILIGSYIFYGWWRVDFAGLLLLTTIGNYLLSRQMLHGKEKADRKPWLTAAVVLNLGVLAYFKYFNFGVDAFSDAGVMLGFAGFSLWDVILPIGISFYIFQAVSYQIDVYRGDAPPAHDFLEFACFLALFPQLIAGPVIRYKDVADQITSRTHSLEKFNQGVLYFCAGFCKKVLIADSVAPVADMMFALQTPTLVESWLGATAYTLQLYYDFCGYSQMAIGLGMMMGFRFIENFNHPYISRSITEFWQRWHISLSQWLRDYLYIPLGGNRKGVSRTYVNLFLTMLLGGFWHGAAWTFFIWGAWHGGVLALERLLGGKSGTPYPKLLAWPITMLAVIIGWVLFRATSLENAGAMYQGMLGMSGMGLSDYTDWQLNNFHYFMMLVGTVVVFTSARLIKLQSLFDTLWAKDMKLRYQFALLGLFGVSFMKLVAESNSPFLYFQF